MKKNNNLLEIPNINSKDAKLKKLIYDVDDSLFNKENYSKEKFEHLCVCSGGTTSSCAKNGFTTLDLRKNHSKIHLDRESNLVTIGGGVIMGDLINYLNTSFTWIIHKKARYIIFHMASGEKHCGYCYYFFYRIVF